MLQTTTSPSKPHIGPINSLQKEDLPIHGWYRFVLSYPPHLVRQYISAFGLKASRALADERWRHQRPLVAQQRDRARMERDHSGQPLRAHAPDGCGRVHLPALPASVRTVTADEVRAFVRTHHRGVLATSRRDGAPQMSPVLVGVDDDGSLIISTRETAMKTANVRRLGRAAVCVFQDEFFGQWVQAEGSATVESMPGAIEALVRYYRLVAGEID